VLQTGVLVETILEGDFDKRPKHQVLRPGSPNIPSYWYSFVKIEGGVVFSFFFVCFLRGERGEGKRVVLFWFEEVL
jgi:hypothetical protein